MCYVIWQREGKVSDGIKVVSQLTFHGEIVLGYLGETCVITSVHKREEGGDRTVSSE